MFSRSLNAINTMASSSTSHDSTDAFIILGHRTKNDRIYNT